jgi:hypothetical protein
VARGGRQSEEKDECGMEPGRALPKHTIGRDITASYFVGIDLVEVKHKEGAQT